MRWLQRLGLRYRLMYERQAYERPDGSYLFWAACTSATSVAARGSWPTTPRWLTRLGVAVVHAAPPQLIVDAGRVRRRRAPDTDGPVEWRAESVVLAAGGFESDPACAGDTRRRLGDAKVRGTPDNTGEMLAAALRIGAAKGGDWSSAHSVQWDAGCPDNESNRELTNRLTRQSYPLGIIVNGDGRRFVDEGADFRNYTYARYGRAILDQPGAVAYQLFDARLRPLLRAEEYDMPGVSVEVAETSRTRRSHGHRPARLVRTIGGFNASIDPAGRSTRRSRTAAGPPWTRPRATGRRPSMPHRSTPIR